LTDNTKEKDISRTLEPWLLLIILTLIWGSSFILIKKGLEAFPPVQAAAARIAFAFIVLIPFLPASLRNIKGKDFKFVVVSGMLGTLIPAILFSVAQTRIGSSISGMLNALTPVFAILIASLFFGFEARMNQIAGVLIGLTGAIGLSFISSGGTLGTMNEFAWLIVLATVFYAMNVNVMKSKLAGVDSRSIATIAMTVTAPFCIMYLFFFSDFTKNAAEDPRALSSLASLALLGFFSTAIGLILYARLIKLSTPVFASSVAYLLPIVAVFWGLLDGETLYPLHFLAMLLIIAGVLTANKSSK
jgi:drug/metabolite transporter (DMT)-like permease